MKKVKVIFDNNVSIVGDDGVISSILSRHIEDLLVFIKDKKISNNVVIALTDVFKKEGVAELKNRSKSKYATARESLGVLKGLSGLPAFKKINYSDLDKKVVKEFDKKIRKNRIEIIPTPKKLDISKVLDRGMIPFIPPFEGGDKGFKDTLAFLSIIEDAKKHVDFEYILVTGDKVFLNHKDELIKEFLEETGINLVIIDTGLIQVEIDNILDLGLGFEKIKSDSANDLSGDHVFQSQLVKKALEDLNQKNSGFLNHGLYMVGTNNWESKVVNLIFDKISVDVKKNIDKHTFEIEASVFFTPIYVKNDEKVDNNLIQNGQSVTGNAIWGGGGSVVYYSSDFNNSISINNYYPKILKKRFTLSYNSSNKSFKILDSGPIGSEFYLV
jgi:hypothetical protein